MRRLPRVLLVAFLARPGRRSPRTSLRRPPIRAFRKVVASISEDRLSALVQKLAGFGTRNTLSDTTSPTRGIGAARQWIFDELTRSSPRLQVSFDTHKLARQGRITRNVDLQNVVALLPGKSPRRIYVTAHYDTVNIGEEGQISANTRAPSNTPRPDAQQRRNFDYNADAPGANDNGSGTALTMELARVLAESGLEFDATLAFVLWAGEEQGLMGARAHAMELFKDKVPVDADFNNDIVGNSRGGDGTTDAESVRVYSEGPEDSMSRSLARYIARAAAVYVPSHKVRLIAQAGSLQPRQRPYGLHPVRLPRRGLSGVERGLLQAACGHRHGRRSRCSIPRTERARESGRRGFAGARASGAHRHQSARSDDDRQAAVRLRRESPVECIAWCGGVPRLLARSLDDRLAALAGCGGRHRVHAAETLDRQLRVRRRCPRPGRP